MVRSVQSAPARPKGWRGTLRDLMGPIAELEEGEEFPPFAEASPTMEALQARRMEVRLRCLELAVQSGTDAPSDWLLDVAISFYEFVSGEDLSAVERLGSEATAAEGEGANALPGGPRQ